MFQRYNISTDDLRLAAEQMAVHSQKSVKVQ